MGVVRPAKLARRDDHLHHTAGDRTFLFLYDGNGRDCRGAAFGCKRECHGPPRAVQPAHHLGAGVPILTHLTFLSQAEAQGYLVPQGARVLLSGACSLHGSDCQ